MEILHISGAFSKNPITSLITILVSTYLISFVFVSIFRKYLEKTEIILENFCLNKHFSLSLWLLLSLIALKTTPLAIKLSAQNLGAAEKIWFIATIIISTYFLSKIISFGKVIIFRKIESNSQEEFKYRKLRTQLDFIQKFTIGFLCFAAFAAILLNFDGARKIGSSLIASAGLAGIIIGFAAQKSLANLIAGFQIAFTQPFKLGDTVVVDGEWGHIKEITLTYIVVKSWDKRNLVVPITYLLEKPFQNWTRSNEKTMGTVFLYVDYSMPVDELRNEFMRLMATSELWDGETASLYVIDATEKTMQIRALISAKTAGDAFHIKVYLRENLIRFIQQNYPQCLPKNRVDCPMSIPCSSEENKVC